MFPMAIIFDDDRLATRRHTPGDPLTDFQAHSNWNGTFFATATSKSLRSGS